MKAGKLFFILASSLFFSALGCSESEVSDSQQGHDHAADAEGNSQTPDTPECNPGDAECKDGVLKACSGGKWITENCPDGCADDGKSCVIPPDAECAVDTCAKDGKTLNKCVDGKIIPEKCPEETPICDGARCIAENNECNPGEARCSDDGSAVLTCGKNGKWGAPDPCGDGMICSPDENKCVETPADECENDTLKCIDNSSYVICKNGRWDDTSAACKAETPICSGEPGKAECKADGAGAMQCTPKSIRCTTDQKGVQTCSDNGTWNTAEPCKSGESCTDDAKGCEPAADTDKCQNEGDVRCTDDGAFQVCADGVFTTLAECGEKSACIADKVENYGCNCANDHDQKCGDGQKRFFCEKTNYKSEKRGFAYRFWNETETCPNGCGTDTEGLTYCKCKENDTKCDGNKIAACKNDGTWEEPKMCEGSKVCNPISNKCEDQCKTGEARCEEDGSFWICEITDDLSSRMPLNWKKAADCGDLKSCDPKIGCTCKPDETKCDADNNNALVCTKTHNMLPGSPSYHQWEIAESCEAGMCTTENGKSFCSCQNDEARCTGENAGSLQVCANNQWIDIKNSKNPKSAKCNESIVSYSKPCGFKEKKCIGNDIIACQNGIFVFEQTCEHGCFSEKNIMNNKLTAACRADDSCKTGETRCNASRDTVQICENNAWKDVNCKTGEICMQQADGFICAPKACDENTYSCSGNDKSVIQMCDKNELIDIAKCENGMICKEGKCVLSK